MGLALLVFMTAAGAQEPARGDGREGPPIFEGAGPAAVPDEIMLSTVADA